MQKNSVFQVNQATRVQYDPFKTRAELRLTHDVQIELRLTHNLQAELRLTHNVQTDPGG